MTCIICAKAEPHDGWTVCNGCLGRLDDDLARIVGARLSDARAFGIDDEVDG
jgi:hypothetical protein